jgi:hypothetical protein
VYTEHLIWNVEGFTHGTDWVATKYVGNFGGEIFWTVATWKIVEVETYIRMYLRDVSSQYGWWMEIFLSIC